MENQTERSYKAFISYRHRPLDKKAAELIQSKIEHYKVPKEFRDKVGSNRLGNVFRDEDELPAASSLSGSITYALDHAEYLIVICTPDLPLSKWCEMEIRYFIQTHDRDHVLAVLVDGEPEESFSPYIRYDFDEAGNVRAEIEPLAANIAGPNHTIDQKKFKKEIVRIYAALIGCPFDALWQRERRYRTTRLAVAASAAFLVMAVFLGVVINKNFQITKQNQQILEQNQQITQQNQQITQQNQDLEFQKSSILVSSGGQLLANHDVNGAISNAHEAMANADAMPYDHGAQRLLAAALGAYQQGNYREELLIEQTSVLVDALLDSNGNIYTSDQFGMVRCYDPSGKEILWAVSSQTIGKEQFDSNIITTLRLSQSEDILYCINNTNVKAVSIQSGEELWNIDKHCFNPFYVFSSDESMLCLLVQSESYPSVPYAVILDAQTGQERQRYDLSYEGWSLEILYSSMPQNGGAFSENNQYLALALEYESAENYQDHELQGVVLDLNKQTMEAYAVFEIPDDYLSIIMAVHVDNAGKQVYVARYAGDEEKVYRLFFHVGEDTYDYYENEVPPYDFVARNTLNEQFYLPCLVQGSQIISFYNNLIFVDDWEKEEALFIGDEEGFVLCAEYTGRTEGEIHFLLSNGEEMEVVPGGLSSWIDFNEYVDMCFGKLIGDGWDYIYITKDDPNRLMLFREINDPHGETVEIPYQGQTSYNNPLYLSPSGNSLFVIDGHLDEAWRMLVYNTEDWSLRTTVDFSAITEDYDPPIYVLDDERVMIGMRIYHTDGTVSYLENYGEETLAENYDLFDSVQAVKITDGDPKKETASEKVITVLGGEFLISESNRDDPDLKTVVLYKGYVDGIRNESILRIDSDKVCVLGKNGYLVMHGTPVYKTEDNRFGLEDTDPVYYVWDVAADRFISIPDACREDLLRNVAVASVKPLFAVADSTGGVRIYSIETMENTLISSSYNTGPVFTMTFFDDDQYLAVHTYTGRLDIYEVATGEMVFSEEDTLFYTYGLAHIEFFKDDQGHLLLIGKTSNHYGECVVIDEETWTVVAKIANVVGYSAKSNQLITLRSNDGITLYPLYSPEELLTWE